MSWLVKYQVVLADVPPPQREPLIGDNLFFYGVVAIVTAIVIWLVLRWPRRPGARPDRGEGEESAR